MAQMTLIQAINDALRSEMEQDERVVVLGEDVGVNGGVFRATDGLQARFGASRVIDTPLSETGIVGTAIGMALYGLRPVPEIQFADYIFPAFDQIVSELAKFRYRSGGEYTAPVVIRSPYGGGIRGGHYHSQSPESYYTQTPGLKVVIPSTPQDARGLLKAAIRGEDPVIFLEPKKIYRSGSAEVPEEDTIVPIGPARLVQAGTDLSIFCYGAMVELCQRAARKAQEEDGASIEIIDLRTLSPVDEASILASVRKTGRAMIVHEAPKTVGYGAEIAALIAEKAIDSLEAPVRRVAGFDTPYPYTLEAAYMPHPARILRVIREILAFQ
jgi:2-oxoisovalerate dehydrogenase E1 component beta subunit